MTFGLQLALAGALLAPAQPLAPDREYQRTFAAALTRQSPERQRALYEEIEVMRQLLARKLAGPGVVSATQLGLEGLYHAAGEPSSYGSYQPVTAADGTPTYDRLARTYLAGQSVRGFSQAGRVTAPAEGTFLDGHGVVFTVTLPAAAGDPRPSGKQTAPAADTEWDRIRKELRGEKPAAAGGEAKPSAPTVGDIVLHTLAENGKHFEHLRPEDRVTVVATFRGRRTQTSRPAASALQPTPNIPASATQPSAPATAQNQPNASPPVATTANTPRTTNDYVLLGDLHLRQEQYGTAVDAYQKALMQFLTGLKYRNPIDTPAARQEVSEQARTLLSKLAQAQTGAGKLDEARATLERAQKVLQDLAAEGAAQTRPALTTKAPPARLPAKLIVSAPKGLLDAVGSGKMEFETFRQQVSVEYLTFDADKDAEKKPANN
jgi:hypothetical protein